MSNIDRFIISRLDAQDHSRYNFRCRSILVYSSGFQIIRDAIRREDISCWHNPSNRSMGGYVYRENKFIYKVAEPYDDLIVHEWVHALQDWHHVTKDAEEAEIAAFVAQGIFYHTNNYDVRNLIPRQEGATRRLLWRATQAARHLISHNLYELPQYHYNRIRSALRSHTQYDHHHGQSYEFDGF